MNILKTHKAFKVNREKLYDLIHETSRFSLDDILAKALKLKGLTLEETAQLLSVDDSHGIQKILETAGKVKQEIYGKRLVFFAPLYVSNICCNNCL